MQDEYHKVRILPITDELTGLYNLDPHQSPRQKSLNLGRRNCAGWHITEEIHLWHDIIRWIKARP